MKTLIKPEVYDRLHRDEQYQKYKCLEDYGIELSGVIIDVGCGTGLLYEYILEKHGSFRGRYICIDPDPGMLRVATRRLKDPFTILIEAYGEELPIVEDLGAKVLSISTWGALGDKKQALRILKAIAGRRGLVVITGHPRTYTIPPSTLDPDYIYIGSCIDDFYIYVSKASS